MNPCTADLPPTQQAAPSSYSPARLAVIAASILGTGVALIVEPALAPLFLVVPVFVAISERLVRDAVTVLTVYVVALFAIPSGSVIGPLGAAGRPAGLVGIVALWWWFHARLLPDSGVSRTMQPVRIASLLFLGAVLASYAAAFVRPIDPMEARAADRGLVTILGLFGALFLAADGIGTRARLEVLLRRVVTGASLVAGVAVFQFFTGMSLASVFRIPGLQELSSLQAIQDRSDFNRVSATAAHPIELGVMLGLVFPLAVHFALQTRTRTSWLQVAIIGMAVPMSVSRSGTLALAIGAIVLWLSWPAALKIRSLLVTGAFLVAMRALVPGLLGTIRSLFTSWFVDNSIQGRTDDYPLVAAYFTDAPIIGRGFGTFIPERYIFLDNQYLGLIVETGAVGTLLFVAVVLTGYATARGSRRFADADTRSLGQAIAAGVIAGAISAGTFDMIGFGMASGVFFLLIGSAAALWRLTGPARSDAAAALGRTIDDRDGTAPENTG